LTKLLVVDASVAVAACHTPIGFASLHGHKLLAPPLMVTEASSALHEMAWRGEITKPRAKTMLGRLLKAPVEIRAPDGLVQAAWNVAEAWVGEDIRRALRRARPAAEVSAGDDRRAADPGSCPAEDRRKTP